MKLKILSSVCHSLPSTNFSWYVFLTLKNELYLLLLEHHWLHVSGPDLQSLVKFPLVGVVDKLGTDGDGVYGDEYECD